MYNPSDTVESLGVQIGKFVGKMETQIVTYIEALERVRDTLKNGTMAPDRGVKQAIQIINNVLEEKHAGQD